jgi:hypothetical protein
MGIEAFANKLTTVIVNPILALIFAAGFLVFVWGVVEFLAGLNGVGEGASNGKRHMLWGVIGMFIMVAAYSILKIIAQSLNVQLPG